MSREMNMPLNKWQKEILKSLKSVWSSVHDCKKVHADFILKNDLQDKKNNQKWLLNISPITQEVLGGIEDGARKNSCFSLDISQLILLPEWNVSSIRVLTACSFCREESCIPSLKISAFFKDRPIEISIYLNSVHDTIEDIICMNQKNR